MHILITMKYFNLVLYNMLFYLILQMNGIRHVTLNPEVPHINTESFYFALLKKKSAVK